MITVKEIKAKSEKQFELFLKSIVLETSFFPLVIRANKQLDKSKGVEHLHQQLIPIYQNEKSAKGFGYTLHTSPVNTKHGTITVVDRIEFGSEKDYLQFIDKQKTAVRFSELLTSTLLDFPNLKSLLADKPLLLADNIEIWPDLMKVCLYFRNTPVPHLYIRELPISVHTKFIENNRGILSKLLECIIPNDINNDGDNFEERFNLKQKHNLIRIRFLDKPLSVLSGFEELGISEIEINQLSIKCKKIFVIENDIAALTFPRVEDAIVIFGMGYNVSSLKNVQWMQHAEIYYWSDLDVQGFEMLSQVRRYFPHAKSLFMDMDTLIAHRDECGSGVPSSVKDLDRLNDSENKAYRHIKVNNIRLEQEKIPNSFIIKNQSSFI